MPLLHDICDPKMITNNYMDTYWAANSLVGVRIRTLIAFMRFGRYSNLSKVGSANAAVCMIAGYGQWVLKETRLYKDQAPEHRSTVSQIYKSPK
jgi:hypothetical protein